MIFKDDVGDVMDRIARENSDGAEIDPHWEAFLPEAIALFKNEIFLAQNRSYIDGPMIHSAFKRAQMTISPQDTKELDIATLALHYWTTSALSGISKDRNFQALVDQMEWVNPSLIWLPCHRRIDEQVFHAMVEHYERAIFAERCYYELVRRGRESEYLKCTHVQLNDSAELRQHREKARKWLHDKSEIIAAGVGINSDLGEDLIHNFLLRLVSLPFHTQLQRSAATGKALHDGAVDMQRKGGRYEHVPLDDEYINLIGDDAAKDPLDAIIDDESFKRVTRILECQPQIEKILSGGRAKLGKRRFQVLQQKRKGVPQIEIAKQLNISEPTITRDLEVIRQSWEKIQEFLEN